MKVLHLITGLATGGAEQVLFNGLAGGLAGRFDSAVVSLHDEGTYGEAIRDLGVPVHALGMGWGIPLPGAVKALRRVVADFQPEVIQGWMYHGNLAAILAGWLAPGRPAVAWNIRHSLYGLRAEKPLTRQVIRSNRALSARPDAILYNARLSRQQHETFGFAPDRGQVIPNGFDLARLRPVSERGLMVRHELGILGEARVVGHVARLHPMKDHARFLRAAARVARDREYVHFLLSGTEVTPDNSALVGIVPDALRQRFHFLGERADVPDLMRAMDVLCQSSWSEAFPNVLGEAMAIGVPCVATDVGDSADIIGGTGVIVPPRDDEALTQGLLAMLAKSTEERRAMGEAARARVESRYSLDAMVAQYARLYEDMNTTRCNGGTE